MSDARVFIPPEFIGYYEKMADEHQFKVPLRTGSWPPKNAARLVPKV
jgi:hypothetical protein